MVGIMLKRQPLAVMVKPTTASVQISVRGTTGAVWCVFFGESFCPELSVRLQLINFPFTPFFISVFFTSSVIIVLISVINSPGSISPRSICSSFVSQSAVISGDWISSGITVMRALPLSVGSSTLVFLLPFRSRKPFCTSFSMVAALVAALTFHTLRHTVCTSGFHRMK